MDAPSSPDAASAASIAAASVSSTTMAVAAEAHPVPPARREQVASIHVFSGLRGEALDVLAHVAVEELHPPGAMIFRQGDPGEKLYLILEGEIRIARPIEAVGAGAEEVLATLTAGDVFGEMALLDDAPRSAGAHAHGACRLLAIHRDAFEDVLFIYKDIAYEVLWSVVRLLSRRLRATSDRLTMLSLAGHVGKGELAGHAAKGARAAGEP